MANITGEKKWSSKGRETKKSTFEPLPPGEYEFKILGSTFEKRKKQEPGSIPYVTGRFEVMGQDSKRLLFPMFFLGVDAGKDGVANVERANGLLGLSQAVAQELDASIRTLKNKDGADVNILNPDDVVNWLKSLDGTIVKAVIKVRKQKDRDPQNEIVNFVPAEVTSSIDEDEDEEVEVEETEAEVDELDEDEDAEEAVEEDEDEETPAPKKVSKLPVKTVAKKAKR